MATLPINVLVVFYSRFGDAEALALAAGVGALRARGSIRLRRLAGRADDDASTDPVAHEHLHRMNRDYVTPRPSDPLWAEVIVLVAPRNSQGDVEAYVESLPALGSMAGKVAVILSADGLASTLASLHASASAAGLTVAPAPVVDGTRLDVARAHGARATELARTLKAAR